MEEQSLCKIDEYIAAYTNHPAPCQTVDNQGACAYRTRVCIMLEEAA